MPSSLISPTVEGTTTCSWDEIIPFAPMWAGVKRILKPRGVFVTTASQPFTSKLVMSNLAWFKYEWVWDKANHSNPFLAEFQPLRTHENIIVFSADTGTYRPQMRQGKTIKKGGYSNRLWNGGDKLTISDQYFPTTILRMPTGAKYDYIHPTQKPVALYEYLIRTYTQPGDLVLDFCAGSGTTALAARNLKRRYIIGDSDAGYCEIARERLKTEFASRNISKDVPLDDLPLFQGNKAYQLTEAAQ